MGEQLDHSEAAFETTRWSVLAALQGDVESERRVAAERASELYWPPVYAAARRLVRSRDEAADLTQGFFADVVFGRGLFEQADPERGSLRSLVRASLKRYATDQWRRESSRGAGRSIPLAELDREDALRFEGDCERAFDRRWALALFEEALRRCGRHYASNGRQNHWKLFEARVLCPAIQGAASRPLAEHAGAHGFGSAAEAAAAVQTVKRRLDAVFREVVGETIDDPRELESEYRAVRALIEGE